MSSPANAHTTLDRDSLFALYFEVLRVKRLVEIQQQNLRQKEELLLSLMETAQPRVVVAERRWSQDDLIVVSTLQTLLWARLNITHTRIGHIALLPYYSCCTSTNLNFIHILLILPKTSSFGYLSTSRNNEIKLSLWLHTLHPYAFPTSVTGGP